MKTLVLVDTRLTYLTMTSSDEYRVRNHCHKQNHQTFRISLLTTLFRKVGSHEMYVYIHIPLLPKGGLKVTYTSNLHFSSLSQPLSYENVTSQRSSFQGRVEIQTWVLPDPSMTLESFYQVYSTSMHEIVLRGTQQERASDFILILNTKYEQTSPSANHHPTTPILLNSIWCIF